MVTAALRSVFVQETAAEIASRWDDLAASLAERFPNAAAIIRLVGAEQHEHWQLEGRRMFSAAAHPQAPYLPLKGSISSPADLP